MARRRSRKDVKDLGKAFNLFESIANVVYDRGGDDEDLSRISLKSVREKIADAILGAKRLALTKLKLVVESIAVETDPFMKNLFFWEDLAKLYLPPDFSSRMLMAISEKVPAFEGVLMKTRLIKPMHDSEILLELGHPELYYPDEFAAIMRCFILSQLNKEEGVLITNGYDNIFYVQLERAHVVMVRLYWHITNNSWSLGICDLDNIGRHQGDCVFSRS